MLTKKAKENLKSFGTLTVVPIDNPRDWIKERVIRERPDYNRSEVIDQFMRHLNVFLNIEEIFHNLDRGGKYGFEIVFKGITSEWLFGFTPDNPYQSYLGLYYIRPDKESLWVPPKA